MLTPIDMISFFLSLFFVDRQQRQWRMAQHDPGDHRSFFYNFTHLSWTGPEPYQDTHQDPQSTSWKHSGSGAPAQSVHDNSFGGWYKRKKHRKMAKMEFDDAFKMRGRVAVALLTWMFVGVFAVTYAMRRLYIWMSQ